MFIFDIRKGPSKVGFIGILQPCIHKGSPIISILSRMQFLVLMHICLISILILSSNLRLDLPRSLFFADLCVKIVKTLLLSSILATCPDHLNLLSNYELLM